MKWTTFRCTLTGLFIAILGVPLSAQDNAGLLKTAPPQLVIVADLMPDQASLVLQVYGEKPVCELKVRKFTVRVDGKNVEREEIYEVCRMVWECKQMHWAAEQGKALDTSGKPIPHADLFKRLKKGDMVLLKFGDEVDLAWLKALKADTVVLLMPPPIPRPKGPPAIQPPKPEPWAKQPPKLETGFDW